MQLRVFAHEVAHLIGLNHSFAYGGDPGQTHPGNGYITPANGGADPNEWGNRSVTVMSNGAPGPTCGFSASYVSMTGCNMRMSFFASQNVARTVWSLIPTSPPVLSLVGNRYFPGFFPRHTSAPYTDGHNIPAYITAGMMVAMTYN